MIFGMRAYESALGLTLLASLAAMPASAQNAPRCGRNAGSPISTDRPQVTNASTVVPCGSLQIENGFAVTGSGGSRAGDLPETSVRLGVAGRTELRLGVPDYFSNQPSSGGAAAFASGFGDVELGVKQQLGPRAGFDLSLIAGLSLPAGANAISSHGYDAGLQLPWSRALSKNWAAAGQLAAIWPTQSGRHNLTGQASVYFDRQLTAPWDAYLEYSGDFPQRGGPAHLVDFGTAYKLSPHQQLDLHCGFGLSSAAPDYTVGLGYSVRLQVFRRR
jgi:hypothetical protein